MSGNKLGKYIFFGALAGGLISLCDRATREDVVNKSRSFMSDVRYYSKNPDVVKLKLQEKSEKYQSIYEQVANDATYFKGKMDELKELSPQVKELVVDTKDAFTEAKDDYKAMVSEDSTSDSTGK
ncbi:YtxH domain-containing protein [Sporosarcina sp. Marseille-Q4063]|uniref:YtxH domain-containing protein n=1 Tax=Sporosarcina sp. Marseille-Q4063 TaxID=2810514 RepID=UPI001BAED076|nr:YtxH domain-containing protein [Sporosarcina sp. Marseille-Q4063]QUW23498.1 YtxH domain-containing protein [Sporosarcina sp. Marseille-Q4063]